MARPASLAWSGAPSGENTVARSALTMGPPPLPDHRPNPLVKAAAIAIAATHGYDSEDDARGARPPHGWLAWCHLEPGGRASPPGRCGLIGHCVREQGVLVPEAGDLDDVAVGEVPGDRISAQFHGNDGVRPARRVVPLDAECPDLLACAGLGRLLAAPRVRCRARSSAPDAWCDAANSGQARRQIRVERCAAMPSGAFASGGALRASAKSRQSGYRSSGRLASALAITASRWARSGLRSDSRGGGVWRWSPTTTARLGLANGGAPVSRWNAVAASAY